MDKEHIRSILPERPPTGLLPWALANCDDELGEQFLVYSPKRVPVYAPLKPLMTPDDWKPRGYERVAECTCFACGHTFNTELCGNTLHFFMDDCGETWPLDPNLDLPYEDEDSYENGYEIEIEEGDNFRCPMCESRIYAKKKSSLRGSRTKQILVAAVQNIDDYTAVIYYLVYRTIYDDGNDYGAYPRDAYVLDETGRLSRFSHVRGAGNLNGDTGDWRIASNCADSIDHCYHDWGSINNRKKGGLFYPDVPSLVGTTGEKTGLEEFCKCDGLFAVDYLKLWRKHRAVEVLVNTGWGTLVNEVISEYRQAGNIGNALAELVDLSAKKPADMLRISKADFRTIRNQNKQWDSGCQRLYLAYLQAGFSSAMDFLRFVEVFGLSGIRSVVEMQRLFGDADLGKIERYMYKQHMRPNEVGILLDTRKMARVQAGPRALTSEELWPRRLAATHDRLDRLRRANSDLKSITAFQAGFDTIRKQYSALQWNDGDLCIVLPTCNGDLIKEGATLRHCVGGYGADHISSQHTIFFVRHYRRPERSYYTLDINMTGRPIRQQLHGYGNERHGVHKEYEHTIPRKVRDFCDRWEQEVLMPWYLQQQKERSKTA